MFLCVHCLKENVACTQNGQCCKGQCTYGRCKKDAAPGAPGTFCDRHDDCKDPPGTCCVRFVQKMFEIFWRLRDMGTNQSQKLIIWRHGWEAREGLWDSFELFMVLVRGLCHSTLAQSSWSFSFCCLKFLFRCLIFFRVQNNMFGYFMYLCIWSYALLELRSYFCSNVFSLLCFRLSLLPGFLCHCISRAIRFHRFVGHFSRVFKWFFVPGYMF